MVERKGKFRTGARPWGLREAGVGAKQAAVYALGGKNAAPHRKNFCGRGRRPPCLRQTGEISLFFMGAIVNSNHPHARARQGARASCPACRRRFLCARKRRTHKNRRLRHDRTGTDGRKTGNNGDGITRRGRRRKKRSTASLAGAGAGLPTAGRRRGTIHRARDGYCITVVCSLSRRIHRGLLYASVHPQPSWA